MQIKCFILSFFISYAISGKTKDSTSNNKLYFIGNLNGNFAGEILPKNIPEVYRNYSIRNIGFRGGIGYTSKSFFVEYNLNYLNTFYNGSVFGLKTNSNFYGNSFGIGYAKKIFSNSKLMLLPFVELMVEDNRIRDGFTPIVNYYSYKVSGYAIGSSLIYEHKLFNKFFAQLRINLSEIKWTSNTLQSPNLNRTTTKLNNFIILKYNIL